MGCGSSAEPGPTRTSALDKPVEPAKGGNGEPPPARTVTPQSKPSTPGHSNCQLKSVAHNKDTTNSGVENKQVWTSAKIREPAKSPVKNQTRTTASEDSSRVVKAFEPAKEQKVHNSPTKQPISASDEETVEVAKETSPVVKGTSPVVKGTSPVAKGTSPVAKGKNAEEDPNPIPTEDKTESVGSERDTKQASNELKSPLKQRHVHTAEEENPVEAAQNKFNSTIRCV